MSMRLLVFLFSAGVVALLGLMIGLVCLQGSSSVRLLGFLQCNYGLTSDDVRIKVGASLLFVLFLALLFGPVVAVIGRVESARGSSES